MAGLILEKSLCGYSLKLACKIIGCLGVVIWGTLSVVITVRLAMFILEDEIHYSLLYIFIIIGLPLFVTVYHILLLLGVHKRWPGLLLPYMIFTMLHVVGGLVCIGISIKHQQYIGFLYALKAALDTYCLLLVTSYHSQLRVINREPAAV